MTCNDDNFQLSSLKKRLQQTTNVILNESWHKIQKQRNDNEKQFVRQRNFLLRNLRKTKLRIVDLI